MKITKIGCGSPIIGIVGCLHGNETLGRDVIKSFENIKLKKGSVYFVLANEKAMLENKRFIDVDLNRCFPGKSDGNNEERIAHALVKELAGCEYVIDIHSTSAETDDFIIVTKIEQCDTLTKFFPIKKVVVMDDPTLENKSLISNVKNGVSIEFTSKTATKTVTDIINQALANFGLLEGRRTVTKQDIYRVYGRLTKNERLKDIKLNNFKEANLDGETFYPILFGEKEYKEVICFMSKKLTKKN